MINEFIAEIVIKKEEEDKNFSKNLLASGVNPYRTQTHCNLIYLFSGNFEIKTKIPRQIIQDRIKTSNLHGPYKEFK